MDSIRSTSNPGLPPPPSRPQEPAANSPVDSYRPAADGAPTLSLREFCHNIPKVDLHRHLEGAITPEAMIRVARKYDIQLPTYDVEQLRPYLQVTDKDKTLLDFLKKFDTIGLAFKNEDAVKEITYQTIVDANKDNVKYLELRFSPMYMAGQYHLDLHKTMDAVCEGVKEAAKDCDTKTGLIVIVERQMGPEKGATVEKLAEEYKDKGVVALDLANDEYHYPPAPYAADFQAARKAGLHVTVHAGEAGGADNVRDAIEKLGAERIGHGVRTQEDPAVEKEVRDNGTTLEICPTSNIQTGAAADIPHHPLKKFFAEGISVTINTDDPAVSGITLSDEYEKVVTQFGMKPADLVHMDLNGVDAAFLNPAEKRLLRYAFEEQLHQQFSRLKQD